MPLRVRIYLVVLGLCFIAAVVNDAGLVGP